MPWAERWKEGIVINSKKNRSHHSPLTPRCKGSVLVSRLFLLLLELWTPHGWLKGWLSLEDVLNLDAGIVGFPTPLPENWLYKPLAGAAGAVTADVHSSPVNRDLFSISEFNLGEICGCLIAWHGLARLYLLSPFSATVNSCALPYASAPAFINELID